MITSLAQIIAVRPRWLTLGTASHRAGLDGLPEVFKARIFSMRANRPSFRSRYEKDELSACRDAVKIASSLATQERILRFGQLPVHLRKKEVSGLSSYRSLFFEHACVLARHYVTNPDLIATEHGIFCYLSGCHESGCASIQNLDIQVVPPKRFEARA
jgi:hypothetical protein